MDPSQTLSQFGMLEVFEETVRELTNGSTKLEVQTLNWSKFDNSSEFNRAMPFTQAEILAQSLKWGENLISPDNP